MLMEAKIVVLPGDGIGPEVIQAACLVLRAIGESFHHKFEFEELLVGGASLDAFGSPLTDETLETCRAADAVLLGAVGGPKWDDPDARQRPEQGLLGLRKGLSLFANLRPVRPHPDLLDASPIKPELLKDVDILFVRELTGGIYFGEPRHVKTLPDGHVRAVDTMVYWDFEIERVVDLAFRLASRRRGKVTSVDKANVLASSGLWRKVANRISEAYPQVELEHQLVDAAAMRLMTKPAAYDVIVTGNMFGDILTDEASVLTGSMGNLPSASLGAGRAGLYEPIHGSAPDIAGSGVANPIGAISSAAMLLRHSLGLEAEARAIEAAVERAIADGCCTVDLRPHDALNTVEMTDEIIARIERA